jgi:hypothetical protein
VNSGVFCSRINGAAIPLKVEGVCIVNSDFALCAKLAGRSRGASLDVIDEARLRIRDTC